MSEEKIPLILYISPKLMQGLQDVADFEERTLQDSLESVLMELDSEFKKFLALDKIGQIQLALVADNFVQKTQIISDFSQMRRN